jgi:hypothetical protein
MRNAAELLTRLFTLDELRIFIHNEARYPVEHDIDWNRPLFTVASEVVWSLHRRGLLDATFFAWLAGVRPHLAKEIWDTASKLDVQQQSGDHEDGPNDTVFTVVLNSVDTVTLAELLQGPLGAKILSITRGSVRIRLRSASDRVLEVMHQLKARLPDGTMIEGREVLGGPEMEYADTIGDDPFEAPASAKRGKPWTSGDYLRLTAAVFLLGTVLWLLLTVIADH